MHTVTTRNVSSMTVKLEVIKHGMNECKLEPKYQRNEVDRSWECHAR